MTTLAWIVISGVAMTTLAMVGGITLVLSDRAQARLLLPLVAFAGGSLLGGALFHMLPESVAELGNRSAVYVALVAGFVTLFVMEQFLQWHHCHLTVSQHGPLGHLILLADGLHNLIGGLAVGSAFVVDIRLGVVTWLVAAAHEVPQELGDFGILVHSGWRPRSALLFNLASASTFLVGGVIAYLLAGSVDVAFLVPFAAGNFVYIAAADLIPQVTSTQRCETAAQHVSIRRDKIEGSLAFGLGLLLLFATTELS